jgi:hypothetical protein
MLVDATPNPLDKSGARLSAYAPLCCIRQGGSRSVLNEAETPLRPITGP